MLTPLNVLLGNNQHLKQRLYKTVLNIKENNQLNQIRPQPKQILQPSNCQSQSILLTPHQSNLEKLPKLLNYIFKISQIYDYRLDTIIFCLNNDQDIESISNHIYEINDIFYLVDQSSQSNKYQASSQKKNTNIFYLNEIKATETFIQIIQRTNRDLIHLRNFSSKHNFKYVTQIMVNRYTKQISSTIFKSQIDHMKYLLTSHQKEIKLFTSDIPLPKNLFNLELEIIIALAEKEKEYFSPYPHSYYSDSEVVIYCQKCNYLIKQNDRLQKFQFPSYLRLKLDNLTYINAQQQCNICRTTLLSISQGFIIFQFYYKVFYLSVIDNLINSIIDYKSQSSDKCKIEEEEEALNHIYKISNQNNIDFKISKQNKQENKEEGNEKKYNIFDIQYPSIEKSNEILSPQINTLRQPEQSTKIKIVNNTQHSIMNINQFIQVMFLSNEGDEKSQIFNLISNLKQKKYRMKRIEQFTQSPVISEQFIFHNCPIMEFELYEDDKIIPYREYFSKYSIHFFFIFIQYQRTDTMNKKVLDMIKKLYPLDRQRMAIIVTNWSGDIKQKIEVQQKFKHYCFKQIIFLPQKARKQEILKEVEQCLQNVNAIQQNFKNTVFEVNNNVYADELINRFGLNYQMSKLRNRDNQDNYLQDLEIEKKKRDEELLKEEILQMKQLQNQRLERKRNCGRKKKVETQNNQEIISKRIRKQTTRVVQKRIKR